MSVVEHDELEASRLRRVLNRSAVIQAERRRGRRQLMAGVGGVAVVAVLVGGVAALSRDVTPLDTAPAGNARSEATASDGGGGGGGGSGSSAGGGAFEWQSGVLGAGIAGPAYGAGLVFVMTADRSVMAIDPANGDVVWSHPIVVRERDLVAKTTATVDFAKGLVIASGPDIPLQALDAKTGNARWTTAGTSPTPAFRGVAVLDDVVAAANTTGVAAFDLLTGEPLWAARTPPVQGATARGSVVVALADKAVVAVERSTGKVRWTAPLPTTASARPSFESDTIIVVVDDDGGVHRLALDDGRIVATVKAATCRPCTVPGQESASQPTMVAGFVVVGTDAGVVGIDTRTSTVAWTYPTRTPVTSSPVPAGRTSIVVATASPAALVEIDVTSGRQLSSVPLPAPPSDRAVVLKSRVVVSTLDGRVRAVGR